MIHATIIISGVVQGVGFRFFTVSKARQYGLKGYVKNLPSGKVRCEVEGEPGMVNDFIKELRIGPSAARVSDVSVDKTESLEGYQKFEVRF